MLGGGAEFRFVNRLTVASLEQANPGPAGQTHLSSDLRVIVRVHSEGWARVWNDEGDDLAGAKAEFAMGERLPPVLAPGDVTVASQDFRCGTTAVDGIHPTQLRFLAVELLECLRRLLRADQAYVHRAPSLAELIFWLLPKDTGVYRTIGLFSNPL